MNEMTHVPTAHQARQNFIFQQPLSRRLLAKPPSLQRAVRERADKEARRIRWQRLLEL